MRNYVLELKARLERDFLAVHSDQLHKEHDQKWRLTQSAIWTLQSLIESSPFSSKAEEIHYFKEEAPFFYMTGLFHNAMSKLELNRVIMDTDAFAEYVDHAYAVTTEYLRKFRFIHAYYLSGKTNRDYRFTADQETIQKHYCRSSLTLAKVMAYQKIRPILQSERQMLAGPNRSGIELNLDKTEVTELLMAFYEAKIFMVNGKPAKVEQLTEFVHPFLNYNLRDILSVDNHNRMRKKDITPLLNKLMQAYQNRINRLLD